MPKTYVNISSTTLGSNQSTVTLSSIPSTYTDLVVLISARSSFTGANFDNCYVRYNGDTATNYSDTVLYAQSSTSSSARSSNATRQFNAGYFAIPTAGSTASAFSNMELYLPNYTVSANKPLYHRLATMQSDSSTQYASADAGLWRNTATISSITFSLGFENFVTGSSFYLYGIKNS